jgi:heme ABC exporter ATP-binding subunit CcmA
VSDAAPQLAAPAPDEAPADDTVVPAVDLRGVDRRWGRQRVLRGVSLQVAPGRLVALHGHNGSGKTTLLRLIATRLRPSAGTARVFGHDLVRDSAGARRRLAYLSVQSGSYGALTARENLKLVATVTGAGDDEVAHALHRVGLEPHAERLVRVFSSGMKRRLGLAKLLLGRADLWLLDEPYASLDEDGRRLVDGLLDEAKRDGRTVLVVSHEPERLVDRVDAAVEVDQGTVRAAPLRAAPPRGAPS